MLIWLIKNATFRDKPMINILKNKNHLNNARSVEEPVSRGQRTTAKGNTLLQSEYYWHSRKYEALLICRLRIHLS